MKNKKILIEIVLIPLCVLYLIFTLLKNHELLSEILCYITVFITSLEFIIKNFKEVYIYHHKYNYLKIIFAIFNIILLFFMCLTIFYNNLIINNIFIFLVSILLINLLIYTIINIIKISKNDKKISIYIIRSFLSFLSFCLILPSLIIFN